MDGNRSELLMAVEGMTCAGCAEAVRRAIRRLDPGAEVRVDLETGRVSALTGARGEEVARALTGAGYAATAIAG